jgi:SAM-dependent methyltransferase
VKTLKRSLRDQRLNSSRVHLERFVGEAAASIAPGARVLDAGAGDCRYQRFFSHASYESADFCEVEKPYAPVDYVCDLHSIPVEDERYDLVLLTQVLEHLPEPGEVLTELFRVLRPGGELWLSTPLFYAEHEQPYDFYRYTQFGLRHVVVEAGFEVVRLEWLEGYLGTVSYQLDMASRTLPLRPGRYGGGASGLGAALVVLLLRPLFFVLSLWLARLDAGGRHVAAGHPKNYCLIARRPEPYSRRAGGEPRSGENRRPPLEP